MVESVDKAQVLSHACDSVSKGLVSSLFPERAELWKYLQDTKELECFVYSAIDEYSTFYDQHSKEKEKYANLYLTWLNYITSFTCRSQQSLVTLCTITAIWEVMFSNSTRNATNSNHLYTLWCTRRHAVTNGSQNRRSRK